MRTRKKNIGLAGRQTSEIRAPGARHTARFVRSFALVVTAVAMVAASAARAELTADEAHPRIVNGVNTADYPSTVAILASGSDREVCTGVQVGCSTIVTAAHCVCVSDGSQCQTGGLGLADPGSLKVFHPHAGFFDVIAIDVHPDFVFGVAADVAVLHLGDLVTSVTPARVHDGAVPPGTAADIVGYGLTNGNLDDGGMKRLGRVEIESCSVVPGDQHLCWSFDAPVGPPGEDSNTCLGDSGGPLFIGPELGGQALVAGGLGGQSLVAGVTSGGVTFDCQTDDSSFDTDLAVQRSWLQDQIDDFDASSCSQQPQAGDDGAPVVSQNGELDPGGEDSLGLLIAAGVTELRVALNGVEGQGFNANDFDLALGPAGGAAVCQSERNGPFEYCSVANPSPGAWTATATAASGSGEYQLTATLISGTPTCVTDETTLCIDGTPGDGKFQLRLDYETTQGGGRAGQARSISMKPVGLTRGGVFYFRNAQNPELFVKILDACANNGHYWLFYSAGTNFGFTLTVTDLFNELSRVYENPDLVLAESQADLQAFPCSQP